MSYNPTDIYTTIDLKKITTSKEIHSDIIIRGENIQNLDEELKTSVNLFRILFSYLSGNKSYLDALQLNESYLEINKNASQGIYKVIDEDGKVVLKRNGK